MDGRRFVSTGILAVAVGVGAALAAVAPAAAQQVEITATPPARAVPEIVPPGLHYEQTRPSDADYYPRGTRVEHDPAFIEPFSAKIETPKSTGRMGLSGWTAPNTPVGAEVTGHREVTGWFALGFSITWDGPPPARRRAR
jgi:hypothetical protein